MEKINFRNNNTPAINQTNLNKMQDNVEDAINEVMNSLYPVGSIYMSVNSTNPSTLFGGTWEQIKDTFLLATGDSYAPNTTGGEAEHTLTTSEIPSHQHALAYGPTSSGQSTGYEYGLKQDSATNGWQGKGWTSSLGTFATGGGQAHNNMPPYLTVYMWKRIS